MRTGTDDPLTHRIIGLAMRIHTHRMNAAGSRSLTGTPFRTGGSSIRIWNMTESISTLVTGSMRSSPMKLSWN
jgi:hypothetical protein